MTEVSTRYRKLESPEEIEEAYRACLKTWNNENIPDLQYDICVQRELEAYQKGSACPPFSVFVKALLMLPKDIDCPDTRLVEIGASSGYYSEVLKIAGFDKIRYIGVDFSSHFKKKALELYPDIEYHVADAKKLPFEDRSQRIVVSGSCILHILDYEKAIQEAIRISREYVIFHRTPVLLKEKTSYFLKDAYGMPCLEIHFSQAELINLFTKNGLEVLYSIPIFSNDEYGHYCYVARRVS